MKLHTVLFTAVLLAGCSQAPQEAASTKPEAAKDMQMSEAEHKTMPSAEPAMTTETAATAASATGTVESVDTAVGKITIAHGPVEALKWPAMTMGFKATPEQIATVQAGQKVQFDFEAKGMEATITQISPAQ